MVPAGTCASYSVHSSSCPTGSCAGARSAIGIAFAGTGAGAIPILPWLQAVILQCRLADAPARRSGRRYLVVLMPINLLISKSPEDLGLLPDGEQQGATTGAASRRRAQIVDAEWAATEWTVTRAIRTGRFGGWSLGYFCGGYVWYAVQVHQTKVISSRSASARWRRRGRSASSAMAAHPRPDRARSPVGQDRARGRLVAELRGLWRSAMSHCSCWPHRPRNRCSGLMVLPQGLLGYAFTAMMGPIVAEIFEGPHFGSVFSLVMVSLITGGAVGPLVTGLLYDWSGNYEIAFVLGAARSASSALSRSWGRRRARSAGRRKPRAAGCRRRGFSEPAVVHLRSTANRRRLPRR